MALLTFLVLDLCLDIFDSVAGLDLKSDGLPRQRLHEDLHVCWLERGQTLVSFRVGTLTLTLANLLTNETSGIFHYKVSDNADPAFTFGTH